MENGTGNNFAFISQTDSLYTVKINSQETVEIPKPFPQNKNPPLQRFNINHLWLTFSAIGLPLGGVVTIFFTILIIIKTAQILRKHRAEDKEAIHAKNLLVTSIFLLLVGIFLFSFFLIHIMY